jgi:hypothetical protein
MTNTKISAQPMYKTSDRSCINAAALPEAGCQV